MLSDCCCFFCVIWVGESQSKRYNIYKAQECLYVSTHLIDEKTYIYAVRFGAFYPGDLIASYIHAEIAFVDRIGHQLAVL